MVSQEQSEHSDFFFLESFDIRTLRTYYFFEEKKTHTQKTLESAYLSNFIEMAKSSFTIIQKTVFIF